MPLPLALCIAGCAGPSSTAGQNTAGSQPPGAPKRLVAAITGNAPALNNNLNRNNSIQGFDVLQTRVNAGAAYLDVDITLRPQLATGVPSVEDRSWTLFPDGRMETTWHLKPGATWHDGAPITADDFAFAVQVGKDPDLPMFGHQAYALIEAVDSPDPRTVVVRWASPFIAADGLFSINAAGGNASGGFGSGSAGTFPLPKHLLATTYAQFDKATKFLELPYWTTEFVGSGPFKLREFARDSQVVLDAFDGYVLGRPKLDALEVRFITDGNTMMAKILAGEVEIYLGRGLSLEQGIQVRDQWTHGRLQPVGSSDINLWPQLLNPDPPVIAAVDFRRALHFALDLREIASALTVCLGNPLDSFVHPTDPEFNDVQSAIVRYPFDPNRAAELIAGLGYARGADGLVRDRSGATISVEIRTLSADLNQKTTLSVVDNWRRVGVDASITTIAPQRQNDAECRATFPGFQILLGPSTPDRLHSSWAPLPANNYLATGNYPRYMNPEFDALVDRYFATVPKDQRIPVLRDIAHLLTDQLPVLPLFQYLNPALISDRILNVTPGSTWTAYEWDVR